MGRLTLLALDGSTDAVGDTPLVNGGTMLGAVFQHGGNDYVVLARNPGAADVSAVKTNPMTLDDSNFTPV